MTEWSCSVSGGQRHDVSLIQPNKGWLQSDTQLSFLCLYTSIQSSQTLLTKTSANRSSSSPGSGMGSFNGMLCPLGSVCCSKLPAFPISKSFLLVFDFLVTISSEIVAFFTRYVSHFSRNGLSPDAELLRAHCTVNGNPGNLSRNSATFQDKRKETCLIRILHNFHTAPSESYNWRGAWFSLSVRPV